MKIPSEIYDWIINIFRKCNIYLSGKLSNNPHCHEESLDITFIEHLSHFASPITFSESWTVRLDTHFIGGRRHFHGWEVADVGVLVFFRKNGKLVKRKVALLQSKRLYPVRGVVTEETMEDAIIGISALMPGSDDVSPLSTINWYRFDKRSKYKALVRGNNQYQAIQRWMSKNKIPVYYLFYNPWKLPFTQRIPLIEYKSPDGQCELGARVIPSTDVFRTLEFKCTGKSPSIGELKTVLPAYDNGQTNNYGWKLESFFGDLLKCNHGYEFSSISDSNIEHLFFRKNAMMVASIAISIELNE